MNKNIFWILGYLDTNYTLCTIPMNTGRLIAYLELHNAKSLDISFEIKPIVIYPWCSPVVELSQPKTRCYI